MFVQKIFAIATVNIYSMYFLCDDGFGFDITFCLQCPECFARLAIATCSIYISDSNQKLLNETANCSWC